MIMNRVRGSFIAALIGVFFATRSLAEGFPEYRPSAFPFTQTRDGLIVSVRPVTDEDELDQYFGDDLVDEGVLPVFVSLDNHSADRSFIVLKENVGVALAPTATEGDVASPNAGAWVSTAGIGAVLLVPVASLILLPIGVNMVSNAYEAKRNFAVKELQSHTLSPGMKTSGFTYLKAPDDKVGLPKKFWLRVSALPPRGGAPTRLELPISWAR